MAIAGTMQFLRLLNFWRKTKAARNSFLPGGHLHLFSLNAPNLNTKQERIDAFVATIAESVFTEEFDNQDKTRIKDRWYLEASSTCPLLAYKFSINFTVYNVDAGMTNYFYHHKYQNEEQIFYWIRDDSM